MIEITREARVYGVKEIARRAGVTAEFFRTWRIEVDHRETRVYLQPGTQKQIRFANIPATFWREPSSHTFRTARAGWMHPPAENLRTWVPDFVVPFADEYRRDVRPLFTPVNDDCVECSFDLPLSTLFSLSRWEEVISEERDQHGRFPAAASLALRDGFLDRPIVDEYGLALEQALKFLLPTWRPGERKWRLKLSHDIDLIGVPFDLQVALGHTFRRGKPLAMVWDLLGWLPGIQPVYLKAVRQIVELSLERGLDSAVYWKASPPGPVDSGYDPRASKVRAVVAWLRKHGVEMGVHPGYETFHQPDRLRSELAVLREVLGEQSLGGRQDYLRWCPQTWEHWEQCGLAYDSSVGYPDQVGFRAGTCIPYRPWLFPLNREARLLEIPLILMDVTLLNSLRLTPAQSLEMILQYGTRCRCIGGVLTLLWHNSMLIDPFSDRYAEVLDTFVGSDRFDWRRPSDEVY